MKAFYTHNISLLAMGLLSLSLWACQPKTEQKADTSAPLVTEDVEGSFFKLADDVQEEVAGTSIMTREEIRAKLLAEADKDGDGQLNEEEKAALKAKWEEVKASLKAKVKEKLDQDGDGEVSQEELKESLDNLGQKIKSEIIAMHESMRAAQDEARAKIREACGGEKPESEEPAALAGKSGDVTRGQPETLPAKDIEAMKAEIEADLAACKEVVEAEREKLQELLKSNLEALKAKIEELQSLAKGIEERSEEVASAEP